VAAPGGTRRIALHCTHIFVLPSRDEGLPVAMLEATAYGLVPVMTIFGSIGAAVSDRVNGLVVAPARPSQTAEVLIALVTDEHLRARLGAAACSRASDFGLDGWYERLVRCGPTWRASSQQFLAEDVNN
jgi:glycosyltransferase involved in cell wall biosynthesis